MDIKYYHKSEYDLFLKESGILYAGLGVFTNSFIEKESFIDFYYGDIIDYPTYGEYCVGLLDDKLSINAINYPRCYMAMLNDASYKPTSKRAIRRKKFIDHDFFNNCYFKKEENKVKVYSLYDIEPGSELFISYGENYWLN